MPGRHMYICNVLFVPCFIWKQRDQVEWPYMMFTLKKIFWPSFMKWIEFICSHPTASVITIQNISSTFVICCGTRQGCLLSPFLFSIVIEPLAASIKQSCIISAIDIRGEEHHISLYADNILLFISHPQSSIPHLLTLISNFGRLWIFW